MYVSCVWIFRTVGSRKKLTWSPLSCVCLFNLLFVPSGLLPHISNSGLFTHHCYLPRHLCVSSLKGLLSLNICLHLSAGLHLNISWTGVKNISSQEHIEFRDYPTSQWFVCLSLCVCRWWWDVHWLSFSPYLHHGESSLPIICPQPQELIIEARQMCSQFVPNGQGGCVCMCVWGRTTLSVLLLVGLCLTDLMHAKHFYCISRIMITQSECVKFTSLSDTFPEHTHFLSLFYSIECNSSARVVYPGTLTTILSADQEN